MSSNEDVVCVGMEASTQNQQRGTSANHQGLTGASITPPPLIPLLTSKSPPATMGGDVPLLLMPGLPVPTGTPHAQQIQALNLLLHAQQLHAAGGSGLSVQTLPKVRVAPGVREGARKKVVLEREIKPSEEQEEINKMAKEEVHQTTSKEVFSAYENRNPAFVTAKPHPADIVEAASLADVPLPPATYSLQASIPSSLISSSKLSSLQLEGILYACQRHLTILPNGSRAGFFIGDGAGVGKGRQIAGIILDSCARGRYKHVWFSVSHDLKMDAERDLRDIGCYIKVIDGCQQLDKETRVLGLPAGFKEGVVFSTYATLVSSIQKGGRSRSRLQQLVDWCGGELFSGCLIFDECHKAKNFIPGREKRSTKVAVAVTTIQKMLPKARVVYCSATGVSDVKNLAYMVRLGLWGEGMAYKSFDTFLESITQRGLGAAEMLAMEMKSAGLYVSRGLSFRQAEFTTLEVPLSKEQIQIYDTAAHVWNELRKSLIIAQARVGAPNQRLWATFWAAHQRFFKQLCISMKVPSIVSEAKRALSEEFAVVIGLQTTGESSLENEVSQMEGGNLDEFVSLTREILKRFIREHFPTTIQSQTPPIQDLWSVTAKDMLLEFVSKMELPNSPLDDIIDQLGGPECVAEMTGRRGRMVRGGRGDRVHYELRDSGGNTLESLNNRERTAFMDGKKLVAIISDAASTGISLHADMGVGNQWRRFHITMELAWSADKAVQQLGRTHRANQSSGPLYQLITTNLGGERRFAAAVAKRLQTLGALTKGDRRAATGVEFSEFNFDTQYGRSALRQVYSSILRRDLYGGVSLQAVSKATGVTEDLQLERFFSILQESVGLMGVAEGETGDVSRFLNRILGLKVHQQNLIFAYFCEVLSVIISSAKREGRFNEGVTDIMAKSIVMVGAPREVFAEYKLSHVPTIHTHVVADRGVSWKEASSLAQQATDTRGSGFYRSRREQYHRHLYLLAMQKESASHLFKIIRPNTGRSFYEETKTDLLNKYTRISPEEAEVGWKAQYKTTKDHCIHGPSCKNAPQCLIGSRLSHIHLLSGGILPLLSLLEITLVRNADLLALSKETRSLRVVRVQLDDGRKLIGIRYPLPLISEVASLLKALQHAQQPGAQPQPLPFPTSLPMAAKNLTVEPESPVNKKALAKALTPPVTLHNFFKPKAGTSTPSPSSHGELLTVKEGSGTVSGITDVPSLSLKSNTSETEDVLDGVCDNATSTQEVVEVKTSVRGADACSSKVRGTQMKLTASFAKVPPPTSRENPVLIDEVPAKLMRKGEKGQSVKLGKRKSEDCAHIMTALKHRAVVRCPVCGKEFADVSNSDLNHHIDSCLSIQPLPS